MFSVEDRNRVRDFVLDLASSDARIVAAAVVGSLAHREGDRWSDLDLTFSVADGQPLLDVLNDWTSRLTAEFAAIQLFDLPSGASIYRVFLLPGCLQFDLSFTPAADFGARGPNFRLLFGSANARPHTPPPAPHELFGYAAHHALRARFCIERGRFWQAEYWLSGVRDYGLSLACLRRNLPALNGRGYDDLPAELRLSFEGALARSLERGELLRALHCAIERLVDEADQIQDIADMATKVKPQLRELSAAWDN